jgi:hypothetical protein
MYKELNLKKNSHEKLNLAIEKFLYIISERKPKRTNCRYETKTARDKASTYRVRETHGPRETKSNFQEHWEVFSVSRRNLGSVWQVDIS